MTAGLGVLVWTLNPASKDERGFLKLVEPLRLYVIIVKKEKSSLGVF